MAKKFHSELKSLKIHLPGNHVTTFGDTAALRNFFHHQYPRWKEAGGVTSIPAGRLPRLFLKGEQMTVDFEKQMSSILKGEYGEIDVYRSLFTSNVLNEGILVMPNVDGNLLFKSKEGAVELDIVVVHPKKGAFVFNIKNAKNVKERALCDDMVKHTNFIRLMQTFKGDGKGVDGALPVHGVICSLVKTLKESALQAGGYFADCSPNEKRFVIQPTEMSDFSKSWVSILSQVPDLSESQLDLVDDLATRLGSLNSMEGAVALIHKQLETNDIQKINRKVKDGEKILADCINESMTTGPAATENEDIDLIRKELIALQTSETKGEKMSFILWTKEQQKIISHICRTLLGKSSKPCRMLVTGPKGSGKTMLLVFIAHLASKIFKSEGTESSVAICDGRNASQLLFEKLKTEFKGTNVTVNSGILTGGMEQGPLLDETLLLFDECIIRRFDDIISSIQDKQHAILFSSITPQGLAKRSKRSRSSFSVFELKNSLRATCEIVDFAETFRVLDHKTDECKLMASHNLTGAGPDIQSISIDEKSDPMHSKYIDTVLSTLELILQRSLGLNSVLITPFVHQITLQRIISQIQKNEWNYEYRNPADLHAKSTMFGPGNALKDLSIQGSDSANSSKTGLPIITFSTGNHIDGSEYGAVVVLLERSLPKHWEGNMHASLFIAITRATTMLSIILNNSENAPLIQTKIGTANEDAVPDIWKDMPLPRDVNIPAYSFVTCVHSSGLSHSLEGIIKDSSWSKAPVLILGQHECMRRLDEIDQPKEVLVDGMLKLGIDEIRWYKVGSKTVVSAQKYLSSGLLFDRRMYMDYINAGFSALVFLAPSTQAYHEMMITSRKHALMYFMHEEQLGNCPIYTLTACTPDAICPDISSFCDFLSSFDRIQLEQPQQHQQQQQLPDQLFEVELLDHSTPPLSGNTKPPMQSWYELKELGNDLFKEGDLEGALAMYMYSIKKLTAEFYNSLQSKEIYFLVELQDARSKLCTNISKTQFELATQEGTCTDVLKMESLLQYAEKSVKLNPFWFKGHHRVYEAKLKLKKECSVDKLKFIEIGSTSFFSSIEASSMKRLMVLKKKVEKCDRWELLQFKKNVVLVDNNGLGHFKSISEALMSSLAAKPISLLINRGVYEEQLPILIDGNSVDMVGNFEPNIGETNEWIIEDPPVVIQLCAGTTTLYAQSSTVFLTGLSIYNWFTDTGHSVWGTSSSSISMFQCAFKSSCGTAIIAEKGAELNIKGCRSVDTYSAVLALNKSKVTISHSHINKATTIGLEFRDNVSVVVDKCSISDCGRQGISNIRSKIFITSCLLEANSSKLTINEGSVQLDQCTATVKDTKIINQLGNGIVMQYGIGRGTFDNVTIDRCRFSGFLIQAPCIITGCCVTNCIYGIEICNYIQGDVVIENCAVTRCSEQIFRAPLAVKPIIKGNLRCISRVESKNEPKEDINAYVPSIEVGRLRHAKSIGLRKFLSEDKSILSTLLSGSSEFGCAHCYGVPLSKNKDKCLLCQDCDAALYCSIECYNKDKEVHYNDCCAAQKDIKAYKDSINWNDATEMVSEGRKKHLLVEETHKDGKKYRGMFEFASGEIHRKKFYDDIRNSVPSSTAVVEDGEVGVGHSDCTFDKEGNEGPSEVEVSHSDGRSHKEGTEGPSAEVEVSCSDDRSHKEGTDRPSAEVEVSCSDGRSNKEGMEGPSVEVEVSCSDGRSNKEGMEGPSAEVEVSCSDDRSHKEGTDRPSAEVEVSCSDGRSNKEGMEGPSAEVEVSCSDDRSHKEGTDRPSAEVEVSCSDGRSNKEGTEGPSAEVEVSCSDDRLRKKGNKRPADPNVESKSANNCAQQ